MKKILLALMVALTFGGTAMADRYAHDDSVLPAAAKSVIKNNFKSGVSVVKIDKDFGRVSEYEVILNDGSEISFDAKGNWKDVEVNRGKSIPSAFILPSIREYINKNHSGQNIIGIEKGRNKIEVTLSNGIEIKFNDAGRFVKYDR